VILVIILDKKYLIFKLQRKYEREKESERERERESYIIILLY